jgi:hypothetical protein
LFGAYTVKPSILVSLKLYLTAYIYSIFWV